MNLYLNDILSQPKALRLALQKTDLTPLEPVRHELASGRFDRILLTGVGASLFGLYPAWLRLAAAGLPAMWVDAAELIHHAPALVGERTLLFVASQSGRSAEVVSLIRQAESVPPASLLAITNEPESPLGQAARGWKNSHLMEIFAEPEASVSSRTYLNTLAIAQIAAQALLPADPQIPIQQIQAALTGELLQAADGIEAYLDDRWITLDQIEAFLNALPPAGSALVPVIALLGRGPSLAAASCGALYIQEAAKTPALGFQAGEFRHGPLEMASPALGAWIFTGGAGSNTAQLNRKMYQDLRKYRAIARLLDPADGHMSPQSSQAGEERISMPPVTGIGLPLAEIIPVQLLSYRLAERAGILPGSFRHIGKVTAEE